MSSKTSNPLRPIVYRLNNTPVDNLPQYVGFLAQSISQCGHIFRESANQTNEASTAVHKLKTRVSALLQDKTPQGRLSGIVLAKAVVDAAGSADQSILGTWTKMLLSCLNKTDPFDVKKLALITITRIFLLTVNAPSLIREVSMPVLPSFISTSLNIIRPTDIPKTSLGSQLLSPVLETVLQCWHLLIPEFPSTFRPYIKSLKTIALDLLGSTTTPKHIKSLAGDIFAALPWCSPKNATTSEWETTCQQLVQSIHQTADVLFRSVAEDWKLSQLPPHAIGGKITSEIKTKTTDIIGLEKWSGLRAGVDRLQTLLSMLRSLIACRYQQPVSLPVASILDMTGRLAGLLSNVRSNPEVSRDERDELRLYVPQVHLSVADLLRALITICEQTLRPIGHTVMLQLLEIFETGSLDDRVRATIYLVMHDMLDENLVQLVQPDLPAFNSLIKACCDDLSTADLALRTSTQNGSSSSSSKMSDGSSYDKLSISTQCAIVAKDLLPMILAKLADVISSAIRTQIDHTIILADQQEAMLASVLHQHYKVGSRIIPSIIPFLARAHNGHMGTEALLRPRMPVIRSNQVGLEPGPDPIATDEGDYEEHPAVRQHDQATSLNRQEQTDYQPQEIPQSPQKREYHLYTLDAATTENGPALTTKRPREASPATELTTDHMAVANTDTHVSEVSSLPQNNTNAAASDLAQDANRIGMLDANVLVSAGSAMSGAEGAHLTTVKLPTNANDSSSDDDDIPEIDVTISDEESEHESDEQ